jgi:hypothetical protein
MMGVSGSRTERKRPPCMHASWEYTEGAVTEDLQGLVLGGRPTSHSNRRHVAASDLSRLL